MTPQVLEDRLIDFAVRVVSIVEPLPNTKAGNPIANQLIRSGTSPAPNYGEARSAESRRDFIHKMKIALKELRETMIWLKIISRRQLGNGNGIAEAIDECNEIIAIFVSSTRTADENPGERSEINNQKSTIVIRQSLCSRSSGCFLPDRFPWIRRAGPSGGILCTGRYTTRRSSVLRRLPGFRSV